MDTKPISAFELKEYWNAICENHDNTNVIPWFRLPSWNEICSEMSWHRHSLNGGYFSKKHHGRCGVYRLIGLATEGNIRVEATLDRVCGKDTTGTLYIGEAGRLNDRLNFMRLARHNASVALKGTPLGKVFPPEKRAVELLLSIGK
jgi:hypothetical protein